MRYVKDGMHGVRNGNRLWSAEFNEAARGDDGTGTLQLRLTENESTKNLTGGSYRGRPKSTQHVCTPAVSPDGANVIVSVEMPTTAPGVPANFHANRHGGKGVYTDLYRLTPTGQNWTQLTHYAPVVNTSYFPTTPAGSLIPQWIGNSGLIWTEMIGYHPSLPLAVRRIVVADFRNNALENLRTYTPGWAAGARFYEVWGIKDGVALVCSDLGRTSQAVPGIFAWEIGSDELVPLSSGNPADWEEQAFFSNGSIYFMSTAGLGYQPIGGNGQNFWRTFQTEIWRMDPDGSHRERVTFINDAGHRDYVPRVSGDAVRVFPFSATPDGLLVDVVRNRESEQLHAEAQIWFVCT